MRKRHDQERPAGPRLADFDIVERLCFSAGWEPRPDEPADRRAGRWRNWHEYLRDWAAIRPAFIAERGDRRPNGEPLWADLVAAYAEQHGLAALEMASDYAIRGEPEPLEGETWEAYSDRVARLPRDREQ